MKILKYVFSYTFSSNKTHPIMFERVTTNYQTLHTRIDHSVTIISAYDLTRYHTFFLILAWFGAICNALPSVTIKFIKKCILIIFLYIFYIPAWIGHNATRYHNCNPIGQALPYIFSQFSMVWGYLQRVTRRYHQIYKKAYVNIFFKKLTVTR